MPSLSTTQELRVLVLMPTGRDAQRTVQLLQETASVASVTCADLGELCREVQRGAGAVLLTDEALLTDGNRQLAAVLREQPAWSALPVLVLTREGASQHVQQVTVVELQSVVTVERPVRMRTLSSVVSSALRARRNQYQIRDALREREQQAAELVEQDEKLRFALSAGRLGSWELDLATDELSCSEICHEIFDHPIDRPFSYAELLGRVHPDDVARVEGALAKSLATGSPYDVNHRLLRPHGETRWVMLRGRAVYDAQRRPLRVIGVALDVTERERLHEALRVSEAEQARQADQLRTTDRLKDEFLATLAHELRNPLAPISAALSLLSSATDRDATRRKALGVMQRQVAHMVRLIDDLLDVSRITRGKLALKRERVLLASIVEAAVESCQALIACRRHQLSVDVGPEPLLLDADPTRISQVISNLLNNACKYTAPGGRIRLSVRRNDGHAEIVVDDSGSGIPTDRLEDVFEMFSQLNREAELEPAQGGLGIGLALVRRLVELHGGSARAASPGPGLGSTFTVRLPLAPCEPIVTRPVEPPAVLPPEGKRILVVDDNQDAAEMLALMLQHAGYTTSLAHDGPTALQVAQTVAPHVVILDIGLPGMSGYEVALQMRHDTRLADMALIALTGWGTQEDKRKALDAGFDVHLTKPVEAGALQVALRSALSRHAYGGSARSSLAQR